MALVKCPDCAREISDAAPTCVGCGRPNAGTTTAIRVETPSPRRSRKARIIVGVSALVIIVGYGVANYFTDVWPSCTMNGFGMGECTFTNQGFVPSRICGKIVVRQTIRDEATDTAAFCSGLVWPNSSVQVSFVVPGAQSLCATAYDSGKHWGDVCSFGFKGE